MKYRLPAELGAGEIEATEEWSGCAGARATYRLTDGTELVMPLGLLLYPLNPPIPAEPEPGAYLIGETFCVRWWGDDSGGHWAMRNDLVVRGYGWFDWARLWESIGGPDVSIVPLVPKVDRGDVQLTYMGEPLPTVKLPWSHTDREGDRLGIRNFGTRVSVKATVDGVHAIVYLDTPESRLGAAAAILAGHKAIEEAGA